MALVHCKEWGLNGVESVAAKGLVSVCPCLRSEACSYFLFLGISLSCRPPSPMSHCRSRSVLDTTLRGLSAHAFEGLHRTLLTRLFQKWKLDEFAKDDSKGQSSVLQCRQKGEQGLTGQLCPVDWLSHLWPRSSVCQFLHSL